MNRFRKATFACFKCRNVKRVLNINVTRDEPQCCGERMAFTNNVPAQDDDKGWKKIEEYRDAQLRMRYPLHHGLPTSFDYIGGE